MKRNDFLKTFGVITGGTMLLGCEKDIINQITSPLDLETLSIEDAKTWFETSYLPEFSTSSQTARTEGNKKAYKRKTNWNRAEKKKNKNKKDYILIPIEYEDKFAKPGLVVYDDETSYKMEMQDIYIQPIIEKMIIIKENKKEKAFIVQMSYDPFAMSSETEINESNLTGMLIHSDWNDNPINGWFVEKGKVKNEFGQNDNLRSTACHTFYINYNSMTGAGSCNDPEYIQVYGSSGPCNAVNMTVNARSITVCTDSDYHQHNSNYQNGTYGSGLGGGSTGGGSLGPIVRPADLTKPYDLYKAIYEPTSYDRIVFNDNLKNKLSASGLATDITGWSLGKAEALARSIGANMHNFTSLRMIVNLKGISTRIGWFGAGISTVQLAIGIYENKGNLTRDDALNALQVVLGVAGIFAGPWWALGMGTVSLIIAYQSVM